MPLMLKGELTNGNRIVPVNYRTWDPLFGLQDGRDKLDKQLHVETARDKVIVLGHSYGASAMAWWLTKYGPTSDIDPKQVVFYLLGTDALHKTGATSWMKGFAAAQTTRYQVIDVVREFDLHADAPNRPDASYYKQAVENVHKGDALSGAFIHNSYANISLKDPHRETLVGNVTYRLYYTNPIPLAGITRGQLNTAYDRSPL